MKTVSTLAEDAVHCHVIAARAVGWPDLAYALAGAESGSLSLCSLHGWGGRESKVIATRIQAASNFRTDHPFLAVALLDYVVYPPTFIYGNSLGLRYTAVSTGNNVSANVVTRYAVRLCSSLKSDSKA